MNSHEGIDRNFRFLVVEVRRQVETVFKLLAGPSDAVIRSVLSRDNYTDTLKSLIAKKCISFYRHAEIIDERSANRVTAVNVATTNLERIADFCSNIALRVRRLHDRAFLERFDFGPYAAVLPEAILLVEEAMRTLDTSVALGVCRAEESLDQLYNADFNRIREALQSGGDVDDLLACLYIFHYLERMGDSLLNIGEAILFAATGEKLKLHEYIRLRDALTAHQPDVKMDDYSFDFDLETRSGCRIGLVHEKSHEPDSGEADAIFKKGHADKIRKERANIARWEAIKPGVPPRVLEFREGDDDASLLLEFLDGYTLRDLALNAERSNVDRALDHLEAILRDVWTSTRRNEPVNAGFMRQTRSRLDDVFRLHPRFRSTSGEIGSVAIASLADLLQSAATIEETLSAPFTVLVHGDLNGDNVIYNQREERIHLIDLYRTHESDWLQDISVLLVSNFRLPVFSGAIRETLNHAILRLYDFARAFAAEQQDGTYGVRLALGLARSLITSTRFEIDENFAGEMYSRAVYLLEKIVNLPPDRIHAYQPSSEVLIY